MEFRHLRYFLAVAEAGHMTRAAERLGIQQPPLSLQIKALEAELGVSLFQRHPKGVSLTDAGRQFEQEARRLVDEMAAMQGRMARVARGELGLLNVGFTSSAAAHAFTPEALRACRRAWPGITLSIREDHAAGITEAVAAGRLHCGLIRVPVALPEHLSFELLLREPVVVALPVDHPLAAGVGARRGLALTDLRQEGFILVRQPGAPGLYANLLALCEARGFRPRIAAEVERMVTSLNLVAAGAGVAVVPASMRGLHPQAVTYRPLADGTPLDAPLTLVYRTAEASGPAAHFLKIVRDTARRHQARGRKGSPR
ncbi:MAG: LysR family transcriptional regulator [Hydrogenophaga sp.]|uniref:LysR family transcriptional regulator n=1 Tax=Hydrogenophaga sp. TaxID=1904254 RepID=UPI0016B8E13C|nr:LysR family transcriptional regulator [Hydrogenophaga sp.]NIM43581.1 LysR family transcriptional regulator [Hydrogenophaga sp.]NIN28650.1 LysR family transcriptional regulator [Hydrogenophaga sp.]NIN33109.1 LysR family transcriptional regulator [Hydrogenophaga sp.]NIN57784.1 LysR family transcriptional regulator [Hydrogenophaga sp.]NIO54079.1 LysR family transcriptional regulator [Hydrogenophaga sp.]